MTRLISISAFAHGNNRNYVLARGDFGDDAAVLRVQGCLGYHYIAVDAFAVLNDGGGLVAGCFDAKDFR